MKRFCYLALFLLVWSSLGACVPIPSPTSESAPSEQGASEAGEREAGEVEDLSANPDYILLTGLLADIRAVIADVNTRNDGLLELQELDNEENLITIELGGDPSAVLFELFGEIEPKGDVERHRLLTIARIFVKTNEGFPTAFPGVDPRLLAIEQVRLASTLLYENPDNPISLPVYAELDLATAVGSVTGDPNSIGAHAFGPAMDAGGSVEYFWKQWALGEPGIGLFLGPTTVDNHPGCTSNSESSDEAPRVVVFDTVPFTLTDSIRLPTLVQMPLGSGCVGDLDLTISEEVSVSAPGTTTVEFHGLFASALVHAAAPESQVQLVRVLDSDGTGDLFDLLQGIMNETNAMAIALASGEPRPPTVFNFSLGIHPDSKLTEQEWIDATATAQDIYGSAVNTDLFRQEPLIGTDPEVDAPDFLHPGTEFAVELVIWATRQAGIIMVAASGNDSVEGLVGEQYPAAFISVLGVGAYGPAPFPVAACYSNIADVYEPAGDGDTTVSPCDTSVLEQCTLPDCPHAVISMIGWPGHWRTAFWSGTSFAAPLASGMVALRLNDLTSIPAGGPPDLVDILVSGLQDTGNCPVHISGRCKLDLDRVLSFP